jgi:hypothetical protein
MSDVEEMREEPCTVFGKFVAKFDIAKEGEEVLRI